MVINFQPALSLCELELKLLPRDVTYGFYGIAVNTEGKMAVADGSGHRVYVLDGDGNCLRKLGGEGANSGLFDFAAGVSFLNDNEILIADEKNHRIKHINIQTGTVVKSFGKYGAGEGEFSSPVDVRLDDEGRIVVTEFCGNRIQVLSKDWETISMFLFEDSDQVLPVSCIPYKSMFFVTDTGSNCIRVFDQAGTFLYKFGKGGNQDGQLNFPQGVFLDSSNNLFVCDYHNNRVQQFSLDGRFTGKTITDLPRPHGIVTAPDGRIFVTSGGNKIYLLKKIFFSIYKKLVVTLTP